MAQATRISAGALTVAAMLALLGAKAASAQTSEHVVREALSPGDPAAVSAPNVRVAIDGPVVPLATSASRRVFRATFDGGPASLLPPRVVRVDLDRSAVAPLSTPPARPTPRIFRTEL